MHVGMILMGIMSNRTIDVKYAKVLYAPLALSLRNSSLFSFHTGTELRLASPRYSTMKNIEPILFWIPPKSTFVLKYTIPSITAITAVDTKFRYTRKGCRIVFFSKRFESSTTCFL